MVKETKIWQKIWWNKPVQMEWSWFKEFEEGVLPQELYFQICQDHVYYTWNWLLISTDIWKKFNDWNLIPGRDHQPSFSFAYSLLLEIKMQCPNSMFIISKWIRQLEQLHGLKFPHPSTLLCYHWKSWTTNREIIGGCHVMVCSSFSYDHYDA